MNRRSFLRAPPCTPSTVAGVAISAASSREKVDGVAVFDPAQIEELRAQMDRDKADLPQRIRDLAQRGFI